MSNVCKYHGKACENPTRCIEWSPRKYKGDGHLEVIDSDRLVVGCVVRLPYSDGGIPAFEDTIVTDISVYSFNVRQPHLPQPLVRCTTLTEAIDYVKNAATNNVDVVIKLARPYMVVRNVAGLTSPLIGTETLEVIASRFLEHYRVVTQSTGEYTVRLA